MARPKRQNVKTAPKKRTRKAPRKAKKPVIALSKNWGILCFSGFMLISFIAASLYFFKLDIRHSRSTRATISVKTPTPKPIQTARLPEKPRFEFYNILPKLTVQTKKSTLTPRQHHRYDVQVASTKSAHDAEQMRARIILHGLDAHVIRVKTKSGTWYRVALGPYTSSTDAQAILKQLRRHDLDGIIRRLD